MILEKAGKDKDQENILSKIASTVVDKVAAIADIPRVGSPTRKFEKEKFDAAKVEKLAAPAETRKNNFVKEPVEDDEI